MSDRPFDPRRGRWIPWMFVGAMLMVVVVNGIMAFIALSTFTGVSTPRAYDRGLTYNDVLQEAARQDALGLRAAVTLRDGALSVTVRDAAGVPATGRLAGALQRPLTRETVALEFVPAGPGQWLAEAAPGRPGQWEARLTLHGPAGPFDIRARVMGR